MPARLRPSTALVLFLAIASAYWLWFGLTQRTINNDEGISILAAQGTLEHGYPRLPSGLIYHRAYVPSYLLAGTIRVFGLNDFSIMLPSLLFALGSLWLVYLFARDILGRPWVGVSAAALLLALQIQTFYATGPRMYMALQFFTMLAFYSAWRGYVKGDRKFQLVTALAIGAGLLSHREAAALLVAIPLSVLAIIFLRRQTIRPVFSLQNLGGLLLVGLVVQFLFVHEPADEWRAITSEAGGVQLWKGLFFNPTNWLRHLVKLEQALPYAFALLPVAVFLAVRSIWRRQSESQGLTYALLLFTLCALPLMIIVRGPSFSGIPAVRFTLFLLPILTLMVCASVAALIEPFRSLATTWPKGDFGRRGVIFLILAGGIIANFGFVSLALGRHDFGHGELITRAYGVPCQLGWNTSWCFKSQKSHLLALRSKVKPGDSVIASNPLVTGYYLGRQADGWLIERKRNERFSAFQSPTDEYFGIPLIDTIGELVDYLAKDTQVWVITDDRAQKYSSQDTRNFLERMFDRCCDDIRMVTYINCIVPPCGANGGNPDVAKLPRRFENHDEAIRLRPLDAEVYYDRGVFYTSLGLYQRAIRDFDQAISLDTGYVDAVSYRARVYAMANTTSLARPD